VKHSTQVRLLEELISKVQSNRTADAGCLVKNPAESYTDTDLAEKEWTTFFREHPQIIGLSGDLPQPGSYFTVEEFGTPILATRDVSGKYRTFINACSHRATQLTEAGRGEASHFVCPFHGWNYAVDGSLLAVTENDHYGNIDKKCHGLKELPSCEKYGLLWVHPQPHGVIDTEQLLGGLSPELENWDISNHRYTGDCILKKRMNWKLANDTFGETYHFARLHRKTLGNTQIGEALACESLGRNHRAVFPTKKILKLLEKPKANWHIDRAATVLYYLFPNVQLVVSKRQVTLFRIYPRGPSPKWSSTHVSHYFSEEALEKIETGKTTIIDDTNVYEQQARNGNAIISPQAAMEIIDSTVDLEDFKMGESTQRNIESGLVPYIFFGRNEAPLHHFHNHFREALHMPMLESVD
jgi:phenylpropionate dioxygenase-like ring-hydroxylating dioxygenase large terminal subunit